MKTASNYETINLDKIEENTNQILEKINRIRPAFFESDFKLSKKAKEEKVFIIKNLFPKSLLSIKNAPDTFARILAHANFSKPEKQDQDFISGLDKTGFKDSIYIKEIDGFISKTKNVDAGFLTIIEEAFYFSLLNSELNAIEIRLLHLN